MTSLLVRGDEDKLMVEMRNVRCAAERRGHSHTKFPLEKIFMSDRFKLIFFMYLIFK